MSEPTPNIDDTTPTQDPAGTQDQTGSEGSTTQTENPWDDVFRDFQSLGESIANAVQSAIHDEKHKESLKDMKSNVEDIAEQLSQSVNETRGEVKSEVKKAVGDMKDMGNKVYKDAKPIITTALQTLNEGIQNLIEHLKDEEDAEASKTEEAQTPKEA